MTRGNGQMADPNQLRGVDLRVVKAPEITFVNHQAPNTTFRLTFQYKHNLHYPSPNVARADLTVIAENAEDKEHFHLSVTETGVFACPEGMSRETIHVETFKALFPYVRALVSGLTALAGIPPIMIPAVVVNEENVVKIEFRPPRPETPTDGKES